MSQHLADVLKALMVTAEVYGKEFTDAAAEMLIHDLMEYEPEDIIRSLARCRKELRNFPTVADIVSRIPGQAIDPKGEAVLIAGKISECLSKHGFYRATEARQAIGEVGWAVVAMSGGWSTLCEASSKDLTFRFSQWSQLAESILKKELNPEKPRQIEENKCPVKVQLKHMPKDE